MSATDDKNARPPRVNVLGVGVHAVTMRTAVDLLVRAARDGRTGYVCVTGAHGIIESQRDEALRKIHNRSFLTVPDGVPVVWFGRARGVRGMGRVYGPDLMMEVMRATAGPLEGGRRLRHFLCGGREGVAEQLKSAIESRVPGVEIVGVYTPPFGPLDERHMAELGEWVRSSKPDFFWVGLSTPKQERFMADMGARLGVPLLLGVGAAFDVNLGLVKDAPAWMKRAGLQWLHRLCSEPRRLWRRYAVIVPRFAWWSLLQILGLKRYPPPEQDAPKELDR